MSILFDNLFEFRYAVMYERDTPTAVCTRDTPTAFRTREILRLPYVRQILRQPSTYVSNLYPGTPTGLPNIPGTAQRRQLPAVQDPLTVIQDLLPAVQDPLTVIQDPLPAVQDKMEKQTGVPVVRAYQYGTKGNTNEDRYVRIHPYDHYDVAD